MLCFPVLPHWEANGQGCDPEHTTKATEEKLKKKHIKVMEWPSQSPESDKNKDSADTFTSGSKPGVKKSALQTY